MMVGVLSNIEKMYILLLLDWCSLLDEVIDTAIQVNYIFLDFCPACTIHHLRNGVDVSL
jgi:hypothetical protein